MNPHSFPTATPNSTPPSHSSDLILSESQIIALRQKTARLCVEVGANVQPGQSVMINYEVCHDSMVEDIIEACKAIGCGEIHLDRFDPQARFQQIQRGSEEEIKRLDSSVVSMYERWYQQRGARIAIVGEADPNLFSNCDQSHVAIFRNAKRQERILHFDHVIGQNASQWTMVPAVTDGWANKVFPQLGVEAARAALWKALETCLRLDEADPVAAWKSHLESLEKRAQTLNRMNIKEIHFTTEGTDLRVGLPEQYLFIGGRDQSVNGIKFVANMPTEEVFVTPDFRSAQGQISVNSPVLIGGQIVKGLKLWMKEGVVTSFEAEEGNEAIEALFQSDPNSRKLGELAIVDGASRVAKTGLFYYAALFDENAYDHVAIGNGYKKCIIGATTMSPDHLERAGCNVADNHYDITIGSRMNTKALCGSHGSQIWVDIQNDGKVVLETDGDAS